MTYDNGTKMPFLLTATWPLSESETYWWAVWKSKPPTDGNQASI